MHRHLILKLLLLLALIIIPATALAADDIATLHGLQEDHEFNIKFTLPVDPESVNSETVYTVNLDTDEQHGLSYLLSEDSKQISIIPKTAYTPGAAYRLFITTGIRSQSGSNLRRQVTILFSIKLDVPPVSLNELDYRVEDSLVVYQGPYALYLQRAFLETRFGRTLNGAETLKVSLGDKQWTAQLNYRNPTMFVARIPASDISNIADLEQAQVSLE